MFVVAAVITAGAGIACVVVLLRAGTGTQARHLATGGLLVVLFVTLTLVLSVGAWLRAVYDLKNEALDALQATGSDDDDVDPEDIECELRAAGALSAADEVARALRNQGYRRRRSSEP